MRTNTNIKIKNRTFAMYKYIFIFASIAFVACGGKTNDLTKKKQQLSDLKKQIASLQAQAKKLEDELATKDPNKKELGKLIEIETIATSDFKSYLEVQGKADADQSTIATAKVPGTVTSVLVREGMAVSAGQALAYLDNNAVKQARGPVEQQLIFATTLYEKQKRLWEQGVGTEVQMLQAKTQKEALEKSLAQIDAQIAMYIITAPISGTIESVDIKVGQAAAPGLPLFRVVNLSGLKVIADVAESYSKKINQGDLCVVEFPDADKKIESRISFASRVIEPINRTFKVEIRMGAVADVKPNMLAKLKIVEYENKKAITVPTNSITANEEGSFVMVAVEENGKTLARKKSITKGKSGNGRTEILSGLQISDRVITNGFQDLTEGQEVKIDAPVKE